jgi:hypothetical protein
MTNVTYTHGGLYDPTAQPTLPQFNPRTNWEAEESHFSSLGVAGTCSLFHYSNGCTKKPEVGLKVLRRGALAPVERPEPEPLLKLLQEIVLRARRRGRRNRGQLKRSLSPHGPPTLVAGLTTSAAEGERQNSIERIFEPRMKILCAGILHTSR